MKYFQSPYLTLILFFCSKPASQGMVHCLWDHLRSQIATTNPLHFARSAKTKLLEDFVLLCRTRAFMPLPIDHFFIPLVFLFGHTGRCELGTKEIEEKKKIRRCIYFAFYQPSLRTFFHMYLWRHVVIDCNRNDKLNWHDHI